MKKETICLRCSAPMERGYIPAQTQHGVCGLNWHYDHEFDSTRIAKYPWGVRYIRMKLHKKAKERLSPLVAWRCPSCYCVEWFAHDVELD